MDGHSPGHIKQRKEQLGMKAVGNVRRGWDRTLLLEPGTRCSITCRSCEAGWKERDGKLLLSELREALRNQKTNYFSLKPA